MALIAPDQAVPTPSLPSLAVPHEFTIESWRHGLLLRTDIALWCADYIGPWRLTLVDLVQPAPFSFRYRSADPSGHLYARYLVFFATDADRMLFKLKWL